MKQHSCIRRFIPAYISKHRSAQVIGGNGRQNIDTVFFEILESNKDAGRKKQGKNQVQHGRYFKLAKIVIDDPHPAGQANKHIHTESSQLSA